MSSNRQPSWAPDWSNWLSPTDTTHVGASTSNVATSSQHTSDAGKQEVEMVQKPESSMVPQIDSISEVDNNPEPLHVLTSKPAVYIEHDRDRDVKYVHKSKRNEFAANPFFLDGD